jgi:hypothetical protein
LKILLGGFNAKSSREDIFKLYPSPFEIETAIAMLRRYKSLGSDQIPAELIQVICEILRTEIHKLIHSIWNKEELSNQWEESITVATNSQEG